MKVEATSRLREAGKKRCAAEAGAAAGEAGAQVAKKAAL
jgi:hypothetical protein